ncbi:MAG: M20/M25/M40 family metallo-hydrolase [Thermoplasmata archaeon]|jgi:acetylornithine deacetylase/succinyl-diaminopimelate desuccinylase-like protein
MAEPPAVADPRTVLGEEGMRLLTQLVATAPTNLEDPGHARWEKPNYLRTADVIVRAARARGLETRIYDPVVAGDVPGDWHGISRPNVIADLHVGAAETVVILAHYDVVPVPAEQLGRWKSPPHTLTARANGRLYARGSNDDLGSGVVGSLIALGRLSEGTPPPRNVRLVACCDEETGGEGGIEAVKHHDSTLPPGSPDRILTGDVVLIPDAGPETIVGSSGVAFLEGSFDRPVPLREALAYGDVLVGLHDLARTWKSALRSNDWPDRHAPEPVITGRGTVTRFDLASASTSSAGVRLLAAHAENDAANQIARAVTLVFGGPTTELDALPGRLSPLLPPPFRFEAAGASALTVAPGTRAFQVVGEAAHGGYPHRGHNPLPIALQVLRAGVDRGWIDGGDAGTTTYTVDLRLPPEMELEDGLRAGLGFVRAGTASRAPHARVDAPPARCRSGYALPPDSPFALRLQRILAETVHSPGIFGEYGGTDASAIRGLTARLGGPLPALVFGSMDVESRIHDAEESVDPRLLAGVATAIERFVREA